MFVVLLAIPLILGCHLRSSNDDVFGIDTTKSLKGFFAAGVILHHLCPYYYPPVTSLAMYKNLGFVMVSGFFLISGYGLTVSVLRKKGYIKHFLWKRLLPIILTYYLTALAYIALFDRAGNLNETTLKTILLAKNYWFWWAILIMYIGFYLSYRIFKGRTSLYVCTLWVAAYMIVMYVLGRKQPAVYGFWWFNSCLAFPAGMWFAAYKDKLIKYMSSGLVTKLAVIVFALAFIGVNYFPDPASLRVLVCELTASVSVSLAVFGLSMKFRVDNIVLRQLGNISLELYFIHALWISFVADKFGQTEGPLRQLFYIIVFSVISAYMFHYAGKFIMMGLNKIKDLVTGDID